MRRRLDTIVIGNGLIGAAAGRHLAERGERVAVIGPTEPPNHRLHHGVFASHYDQGRLVSGFGGESTWAALGSRAIGQFEPLQRRSGIDFHRPVGRLSAVRLTDAQGATLRRRIADGDAAVEFFGADQSWRRRFPAVALPSGLDVLFETGGAGVVDPRAMIRAQNVLAEHAGAVVVDRLVAGVTADAHGVDVELAGGDRYVADRALVAGGAFTNAAGLLPQPVTIRCKTETTVWGSVTDSTAEALTDLPAITSDVDDPDLDDIYIAPPMRYPDGVHRIKLGANTRHESWPVAIDEITEWFRAGESDLDLAALERQLRQHLPTVDFTDVTSHRCIVTYTPTGFPTIDSAPGDPTGRLFVAVGGNGQGAGGSNTLGELAARTVTGEPWPGDLPRELFRAGQQWRPTADARRSARRAATRSAD